jgi:protein-S-isoprenylcysteine O-methyltransferase Ste14
LDLTVDIVVAVVSWAVVAQHIWATRGHFVSERMEMGARLLALLVIASTLVFTVLLFTGPHPLWPVVIGVLLELGSLALFWGAIRASRQAQLHFAFDPDPPHSVLDRGPYRYVRHPFYTSYMLFWLGWGLATWSPWAIPLVVIIVAFYWVAARGEERRFAGTPFGAEYERYKRSAGLFWPRPLAGTSDRRA